MLLALAACGCLAAVWLFWHYSGLPSLLLYGAAWMLIIALQFLISAFGMEVVASGTPLNFGACRALGSLGYAACAYVLGLATARLGTSILLPFAACVSLMLLISLLLWKSPPRTPSVSIAGASVPRGESSGFLRRYPRFVLFVFGSFVSMIAYCMCCNFLVRIVERLGGGAAELGTAVTITALCEIPTIFLSDRLRKRFGSSRLMRFTAVMLTVKIILIALSRSIGALYLVMAVQIVSYSLFVPITVFYADARMRPGDKVRGQAMMTLVTTVGSAVGSLIGGALLDRSGVAGMLTFCIVCSLAGAGVMLAGIEKTA